MVKNNKKPKKRIGLIYLDLSYAIKDMDDKEDIEESRRLLHNKMFLAVKHKKIDDFIDIWEIPELLVENMLKIFNKCRIVNKEIKKRDKHG